MDLVAVKPRAFPVAEEPVDELEVRLAARKAARRQERRARERAELRAWWKREVADCLPRGWVWKIPLGLAAGYVWVVLMLVSL